MKQAVGVIGGVGPMATVYYMQRVIEMTKADSDQEHINMLVMNDCDIPDRKAFITENHLKILCRSWWRMPNV